MKIENKLRVTKLVDLHARAEKAILSIDALLGKYKSENDGSVASSVPSMYGFYMGEYRDGSGIQVDMTGLELGLDLLRETRGRLVAKAKAILKELETL